MTNPFSQRSRPSGWVVPVSLTTLLVGFLASTAFVHTDKESIQQLVHPQEVQDEGNKKAARIKLLEEEIKKLNEEKTRFENAVVDRDKSSETLNKALQDANRIAALSEVEGPGVKIVLQDSHKDGLPPEAGIIHDQDILKVVNELWNAGAEAICIDDRRVGPSTNIRCVGSTVLVDGQRIASPITIKAVGSPKDLNGGMSLPGGQLDELRQTDSTMAKIETIQIMRLEKWVGSTTWHWGKVPAADKP